MVINTVLFTLPEKRKEIVYTGIYNDTNSPKEEKIVYSDPLDSLILTSGVSQKWYKRTTDKGKVSISLRLPSNNTLERYNKFVTNILRKLKVKEYSVEENRKNSVTISFKYRNNRSINISVDRNIKEKLHLEARVAIVIDDFGYQWRAKHVQGFLNFPVPITLSIIPGHSFSKRIALKAKKLKKDYIIHFPMEPKLGSIEKELIKLTDTTSISTIEYMLERAFLEIPGASGLNNHMGSKSTSEYDTMDRFFKVYKKYNKYFLDSYTASTSICREVCKRNKIPEKRRDIFIDNSNREEDIIKSFEMGIRRAERGEDVILIGHSKKESYETLLNLVKYKYSYIEYVTLEEMFN